MGDIPVSAPILTDAILYAVHAANLEAGELEHAFDTPFRHSDGGQCARKMAYGALKLPRSEPDDLPGEWVMFMGTLLHREIQDALEHRFGASCEVEVKVRHGKLSSGHVDALVRHPEHGLICYELKTRGAYAFDKSIGLDRKRYARTEPHGPGATTIIQGALNALASNADLLVIGAVSREAVSRQLAERTQMPDLLRVMAEWHYSRAEYVAVAERELARMGEIKALLDDDLLPARVATGDEGELVELAPDGSRPSWQCVYCGYRSLCVAQGAGIVAKPEVEP